MRTVSYREGTKDTKRAKFFLYDDLFVIFVFLRGFVMKSGGIVILLVALSAHVSTETIDRVLAVVAGQLITLTDVTAARDLGLQTADTGSDPVRVVLTKLIDRELVLAEVERYAPSEPTAETVDGEVQRVRARFPSQDAFDAALARSGIDEQHLRETLRQDLRITAYMNQRFTAAGDRRRAAIDEWMSGLRRRAEVIDLYLTR
jgi:hypothetical protein